MMDRRIEDSIRAWAARPANRPLLVRGVRRVGKTHSVERVGKEIAGNAFVKLDFQTDLELVSQLFEGPTNDVDGIVSRICAYKRVHLERDDAFIMLDEVQLCERALNSLRFFSGSGWRVAATGSQLGVDTKRRSLPFPSGVEQLTMHPMDFEEFLWAMGEGAMADDIRERAQSLEWYPAHREALERFRLFQVLGGMPLVVRTYIETGSIDEARVQQREIDMTYTADMTDPENGISGTAARKVWRSIPGQLLRTSTKKFKYSEVERGGRRSKLLEPIEWMASAGIVLVNELTQCSEAPLVPYSEDDGSFFKVYLADTGLMFYKLHVNPVQWLETVDSATLPVAPGVRGAMAENSVAQAFAANNLQTYYWTTPSSWGGRGELDFLLQDDQMRAIPVEVKSARNVRARTLLTFAERARSPYAVVLSANDFSLGTIDGIVELHNMPLYAAHCLDEGFVRVD